MKKATNKKLKRLVTILAVLTLTFSSTAVLAQDNRQLEAVNSYSSDDVRAMNDIIETHKEIELSKFEPGENPPGDWENVVEWNDDDPRRISGLKLKGVGMTGALDVSALTELRELICSNNPDLSELNVSSNNALQVLQCDKTKLSELDVSQKAELRELICTDTQLSVLNVSNNPELTDLYCSNIQLTELDVSKNPLLTTLDCNGTLLSELDVSKNPELEDLNCAFTKLSNLNVSGNPQLEVLFCLNTQLSELDVSKNTQLRWLFCDHTQLSKLDVSNNPLLEWLNCSDTQLSELDVSSNPQITELYCMNNQLSELSVSGNPLLEVLYCSNNNLSQLDVSNNPYLETLYCVNTQLSELDVSKNPGLTELDCSDTQLSVLDVSSNEALTVLSCGNAQLRELNVSNNAALTVLHCYNNQLSELNVSNNDNLAYLYCSGNPIRTLITKNNQLNLPLGTVLGVPNDADPLTNMNCGYDIGSNMVTVTVVPAAGKDFVMWKSSSPVTWEKGTSQTDQQVSFKLVEDVTLSLWYEYEVLATPTIYTGGANDVEFTVNGEVSDYVKTTINGADIPTTVRAGSTIITLPASYLKTQQDGVYNIQVLYTDGYANTILTIKKHTNVTTNHANPKTGDASNLLLSIVLCMIAGVAIMSVAICRRGKNRFL
ncbi:Leucine-rich repeat (LRR) protein [Lachnospiraceae bacterium PM6-15]|uniref:hypothetical protein n=1 Tax=Ohessyouella blattaphilus TaxID=2949333 RepID=UPI003E260961